MGLTCWWVKVYSIVISPPQVQCFTMHAPIYILTNNVPVPFSLYCHQRLLLLVFLIITILTDGSGILLWFWCAFPWWLEVKHHVLVSHLCVFHGKIPIQSVSPFFLNWIVCSLSILDSNSLLDTRFANIFSQLVGCLFILSMFPFLSEAFYFDVVLTCLFLLLFALLWVSKNHRQDGGQGACTYVFL